ncbi:MAG TPA: response regulator, partial [Actinomycetota bacterium]|nr:response regulator [Actinomycetota bacterium]
NLINQKVAVAMLSGARYLVDTVLNGAAAVKAVADTRYDVILMDCQMPELNGYEATAAIRAQDGTDRHTPIIAMTAGARDEDRARCFAEGMDGYLTKPVDKAALLALVARSLPEATRTDVSPDAGVTATAAITLDPSTAGAPSADEAFDPPEAPPVLDAEVVGRLVSLGDGTDEDFMGQLTLLFTAEADIRVAELRGALAAGDEDLLARVAHNLRGASANLGALGLARLCGVLEATGLAEGESTVESIALEVERVRSALEARIPAS